MVEVEFEAKDMAQRLSITHVWLQKSNIELIQLRTALKRLQDDVQDSVGIQIEASCKV